MKFIALLRGVNVGGNNIIKMSELKVAFEQQGFFNVSTYINSGNIIFESTIDNTDTLKESCEQLIKKATNLEIVVCIVKAEELCIALENAPKWWNQDTDSKHNAFFVIPPATVQQVIDIVDTVKDAYEYEKMGHYGSIIFWSAPIATFSRTRWSKLSSNKVAYSMVTVRNANTALKLAELVRQ